MIWCILFNIFLFILGILVGIGSMVETAKQKGFIIDDGEGGYKWVDNIKGDNNEI
jgi:hypothetical protein